MGRGRSGGGSVGTIIFLVTSDALQSGDIVNIYPIGGGAQCREATASTLSREADGYVLAASAIGQIASVFNTGINTGVSGLLPATRYFLSDSVPGGVTALPVSGSGKLNQYLGITNQAGALIWAPEPAIRLA